jgi:hypothetical protein
MSETRKWAAGASRRKFLAAAAGVTAGTVLTRRRLMAQSGRAGEAIAAKPDPGFSRITGALDKAKSTFKDLAANISKKVVTDQQGALAALVDGQLAKLA